MILYVFMRKYLYENSAIENSGNPFLTGLCSNYALWTVEYIYRTGCESSCSFNRSHLNQSTIRGREQISLLLRILMVRIIKMYLLL